MARWKELITARTPLHALGKRNKAAFNAALETIDKTTNVFKTMKVGQKGEWKPSQTGVKAISLNARRLTRFYLEEENRKFVKLGDFTSDPIENTISRKRILHPNPTAMQVRLRAKKMTISQYMGHVSKFSYDADDKTELLNLLNPQAQAKSAAPVKPTRFSSLDEEEEVVMCVVTSQQIFGRPTMPEIEKPVFYRVCGYILKKTQRREPIF